MVRVPSSSFKLIVATWIAALLGALAGRTLAEGSRSHPHGTHAAAALGMDAGT